MNNSDLFGKFFILNVSIQYLTFNRYNNSQLRAGAILQQDCDTTSISRSNMQPQPVAMIFLLLLAALAQRAELIWSGVDTNQR